MNVKWCEGEFILLPSSYVTPCLFPTLSEFSWCFVQLFVSSVLLCAILSDIFDKMASVKEPNQYTVAELKEALRSMNGSSSGTKTELIARLSTLNPKVWDNMSNLIGRTTSNNDAENDLRDTNRSDEIDPARSNDDEGIPDAVRRELEILRREKALLERELRLASRESEERSRTSSTSDSARSTRSSMSVNSIANLLSDFDGTDDSFQRWKKQIELLRRTYDLDEDTTKILIGGKLKGKAQRWFHSRSDFLELTIDELLREMRDMFDHRPNHLALRREFEERTWQANENFGDYYHDKLILANKVPVNEDELVDYLIDGIRDVRLQDQARMQSFTSKASLLVAFRKIILPADRRNIENRDRGDSAYSQQRPRGIIKCYNCNEKGHVSVDCRKAKRERGSCFICGDLGHQAGGCPKRGDARGTATTHLVQSMSSSAPYTLPISYTEEKDGNFQKFEIVAIVDSGSPVSIIKNRYVPNESRLAVSSGDFDFQGINGSKLIVLGLFQSDVYVQRIKTNMTFLVVPDDTMAYAALLGRDFISRPSLQITLGEALKIENKSLPVKPDEAINLCEQLMLIDTSSPVGNVSDRLDINSKADFQYANELRNIFQEIENEDFSTESLDFEMCVKLKTDEPINFRPRRLAFSEREVLRDTIDELICSNVIRPSESPYASPIVLVRKKNGEIRMCVDYREINKITVKDNFPVPLIDDHLDRLKDRMVFSKLDLKNGFFHVKMAESSIKFTSFVTPLGQYEYLRMPFGLANAPRVFQRFTYKIFKDLIDQDKILMYFDDILVATKSITEHLEILREVFRLARRYRLEFRLDKCSFLYSETTYLGYSISSAGIRPSGEHAQSIMNFPIPRNAAQVHQFLGLASFFRRFVFDFNFGPEEQRSLDLLKDRLVSQPVLAIYSPGLETELHCDASASGFGAILMQKQVDGRFRPVSYFSKRTTPVEAKYHSFELECLSVIYAVKRFHIYLFGFRFRILTDCDSFRLTLAKKDVNPRIARWAIFLQGYDYSIEHRPGNRMKHVDALSRCHSVLILESNTFERVLSIKQDNDLEIRKIRDRLETGDDKFFELRDGLVYRKIGRGKLLFYVPKAMEDNVIRTCHDDLGHVGRDKVVKSITDAYWFPKIGEKVKTYIENCLKCIEFSPINGKPEGQLHGIPKGKVPFDTVHIDHCGPFEKTGKGHRHVLVIVDAFTKFVRLYACKSTTSKESIGYLGEYFRSYSRPRRIISDRGTAFTSDEFKKFVNAESIAHILIAVGTPRANGQVGRVNRDLTPMMAKLSEDSSKWDRILETIEFAINNTICRTTNDTPSRLLFGEKQRGIVNDSIRPVLDQTIGVVQRDLYEIRERASTNIGKQQAASERYYNLRHKPATVYRAGDYVVIRNTDTTPCINKKLIPKFKGPLIIKRVLDHDRYIVGDIEGFQLTQRAFETTVGPDQMKLWSTNEQSNEFLNGEIGKDS